MKPEQWVGWPTFLIVLLEVRLFLRVSSVVGLKNGTKQWVRIDSVSLERDLPASKLAAIWSGIQGCHGTSHVAYHKSSCRTYVLTGSSAATTTCGRCTHFAIWSLGVLLLNVSVQGWVTKVGLGTVLTLKVASLDVILRSALALGTSVIVCAIFIINEVVFYTAIPWLARIVAAHLVNCVWHVT